MMNQQQLQQLNQGMNQGFYNQGLQQGVSQQQLDRIHQASIFNGSRQPDNMYVERIHQASMQNGTLAQPQMNNYAGNQGYTQGFSNQQQYMNQAGYGGQGYTQGMQQGVSQQQLDRIHQASIFNGSRQPDNAYVERIHQASMQNGTLANPQLNNYNGGGMGYTQGYSQGLTNQQQYMNQQQQGFMNQQALNNVNQVLNSVNQLEQNIPTGFNQGYTQGMMNQGFNQGMMNQGFNQGMTSQMGGGNQNYSPAMQQQIDRIHQASMQNGTMANPQVNNYARQQQAGFGGGYGQTSGASMMGGSAMMGGTFNQVMNADAGVRDTVGRSDVYSQALYTGSNQYDTVNQNVLNQLTTQMAGRQF